MDGLNQKMMVSVVCMTYNHEAYIGNALEGFVSQKTNFAYEVIVHDDASTDKTADIIREYEKKYPELIKPIYQTENQYFKVNAMQVYVRPLVHGKYIALCEGDDYWTDPLKLQKQVDAMEQHPEVDICAHTANMIDAKSQKCVGKIAPSKQDVIFDLGTVIEGGGAFVATNSLLYRRELMDNPPQFREECPLDYALQIQGAMRGGMLFLKDNMSVYRVAVPGSWTNRVSNSNYYVTQAEMIKQMLDMVNECTKSKYEFSIQKQKRILDFASLEVKGEYTKLKEFPYKDLYDKKPLKWKVKLVIKRYFSGVFKFYKERKR